MYENSKIRDIFQSNRKCVSALWWESLKREDRAHLCAFLIIILSGIVVRLLFLFLPMGYDEAFTFLAYASSPLSSGLSNYSLPNNHLFHTFLVHIAYTFLGNHPWVIRLPALFAGILLMPASYMAIRVFYNKYAALLTAGFVACSSAFIEYSTSARGYSLICLFFLLLITLARYLRQNRNQTIWFLFIIFSVLGFYTIPIMLYPFGIVMVWLLLSMAFKDTSLPRRLIFKNLFIASIAVFVLVFLLYSPVFVRLGFKAVFGNRFVVPILWPQFITGLTQSLCRTFYQWNKDIPGPIVFLLIAGFLCSLVFHKKLTYVRIPLIFAVIMWCVPLLIIQRVVPFERVWLFLLPLYVGLAFAGLVYLIRFINIRAVNRISIIFSIISVSLTFYLGFNVIHSRSIYDSKEVLDVEKITIFLKGFLKPGDNILVKCPVDAPLAYYFVLYQIPFKYLSSDLTSCNRVLVVVRRKQQTLEEVVKNIQFASYSVPRLIRQYESADIYEMDRLDSPI